MNKSSALQVVFEYLPAKKRVQLQLLNRKWYELSQRLLKEVKLDVQDSYFKGMELITPVYIFYGQQVFHQLDKDSLQWQQIDVLASHDDEEPHTWEQEWPKMAQISQHEYLFVCGSIPNQHEATDKVTLLNTKSCTVTQKAKMKNHRLAHQVIYIPPGSKYDTIYTQSNNFNEWRVQQPKTESNNNSENSETQNTIGSLGYVYAFGGKQTYNQLCFECEKYCIATDQWLDIATMPVHAYSMNLFFENDIIYFFGGQYKTVNNFMRKSVTMKYHINQDQWEVVDVQENDYLPSTSCQWGMVPIPKFMKYHFDSCHENVFLLFGGVDSSWRLPKRTMLLHQKSKQIEDIQLSYDSDDLNEEQKEVPQPQKIDHQKQVSTKNSIEMMKQFSTKSTEEDIQQVQNLSCKYYNAEEMAIDFQAVPDLPIADRFFYNLPCFPKDELKKEFSKRKMIVPGREALHIFDYEKMSFVASYPELGYKHLI